LRAGHLDLAQGLQRGMTQSRIVATEHRNQNVASLRIVRQGRGVQNRATDVPRSVGGAFALVENGHQPLEVDHLRGVVHVPREVHESLDGLTANERLKVLLLGGLIQHINGRRVAELRKYHSGIAPNDGIAVASGAAKVADRFRAHRRQLVGRFADVTIELAGKERHRARRIAPDNGLVPQTAQEIGDSSRIHLPAGIRRFGFRIGLRTGLARHGRGLRDGAGRLVAAEPPASAARRQNDCRRQKEIPSPPHVCL